MMKTLTVFTSLIAFLYASAGSSEYHPSGVDEVAQAIHRLSPVLSKAEVAKLSHALRTVKHNDCKVDWKVLIAVAFKESSFHTHAMNKSTGDYGLMQLNEKMIVHYGLSRDRLLKDETYAMQAGCRVLQENQTRYSARYAYWVGIYRSGTALWKESIRTNAKSYDRHIKLLAERMTNGENHN